MNRRPDSHATRYFSICPAVRWASAQPSAWLWRATAVSTTCGSIRRAAVWAATARVRRAAAGICSSPTEVQRSTPAGLWYAPAGVSTAARIPWRTWGPRTQKREGWPDCGHRHRCGCGHSWRRGSGFRPGRQKIPQHLQQPEQRQRPDRQHAGRHRHAHPNHTFLLWQCACRLSAVQRQPVQHQLSR